jgi:hypothetical protein
MTLFGVSSSDWSHYSRSLAGTRDVEVVEHETYR